MACCAAVVFVLSQIYVVLSAARELIFGKVEEPAFQPPGAAAWRFGDAPAPAKTSRRSSLSAARLLQLSPRTAAASFALGGASVAVLLLLSRTPTFAAGAQAICGHLFP